MWKLDLAFAAPCFSELLLHLLNQINIDYLQGVFFKIIYVGLWGDKILSVSYTHLDVYKRQAEIYPPHIIQIFPEFLLKDGGGML